MHATSASLDKKERKIRKKKLLRAYREDQHAIIWNKVMDEVGFCDLPPLKSEFCLFEDPEPPIDPEFESVDED